MAQVTVYLPDKIAAAARRRAKKERKSLSAFVTELITRETAEGQWPRSLVELLRSGDADLVEPDDPPPEEVEALE